jgi:hypothetical protein
MTGYFQTMTGDSHGCSAATNIEAPVSGNVFSSIRSDVLVEAAQAATANIATASVATKEAMKRYKDAMTDATTSALLFKAARDETPVSGNVISSTQLDVLANAVRTAAAKVATASSVSDQALKRYRDAVKEAAAATLLAEAALATESAEDAIANAMDDAAGVDTI